MTKADQEQEAIAHSGLTDDEQSQRYQQWGRQHLGVDYDPAAYVWSVTPKDDQCRACYEWRRFPVGQRHFGFAWWRICDARSCDHAHHQDEIWLA